MRKILLIIFGLLICLGCKKKLTYQPPKQDISTLIELALNSCNIYKGHHDYLLKNKMKVFIEFQNMKNPLSRKILYYGITAESNMKNFTNKDNDFLITIYYLKRTSEKEFCLKYHIESDNKDVEIKLEYKENLWKLCDFAIINY